MVHHVSYLKSMLRSLCSEIGRRLGGKTIIKCDCETRTNINNLAEQLADDLHVDKVWLIFIVWSTFLHFEGRKGTLITRGSLEWYLFSEAVRTEFVNEVLLSIQRKDAYFPLSFWGFMISIL